MTESKQLGLKHSVIISHLYANLNLSEGDGATLPNIIIGEENCFEEVCSYLAVYVYVHLSYT